VALNLLKPLFLLGPAMTTLTDSDLDITYTCLCTTMTRLGEPQAPLFLARLALLALTRLGDAAQALALIDEAAAGLADSAAPDRA
jgi:hypothetical protein